MKHILSNARLIGTVTPAPKWYPKHKTREMNIKPRYTPKNTGNHKPTTIMPCPCCDGMGEKKDAHTGNLRQCVACHGSGITRVVRSYEMK